MPKSPRSDRSEVTWTRSGCATCKRRRKKCDESRPECQNCLRLGRRCEGYDTIWQTTVLSAPVSQLERESNCGRFAITGLVVPSSSSTPLSTTGQKGTKFISFDSGSNPKFRKGKARRSEKSAVQAKPNGISETTFGEEDPIVEELERTDFSNDKRTIHERSLYLNLRGEWGFFDLIPRDSLYFLQYFAERTSNMLVNLDAGEKNPLRNLLIPRSYVSSMLLHALCAVSACHMSRCTSGSITASMTMARSYYVKGLASLSDAMAQYLGDASISCPSPAVSDDLALTALLLCKYEIVKGSVRSWRTHLNGLERLVQRRGSKSVMSPEVEMFVKSFITYHHNMSIIGTMQDEPSDINLPLVQVESEPGGQSLVSPIGLDYSYMGCSEGLIRTCGRISELLRLRALQNNDLEALLLEVKAIDLFLENWSFPSAICNGFSPSSLDRLKTVASSFRYAAIVYLHSVLEYMRERECALMEPEWDRIFAEISLSKTEALGFCSRAIERLPPEVTSEFGMLTFPLFLVGCESETREQYEMAASRLDQLQQSFNIGNTSRARQILERIWASGHRSTVSKGRHWRFVLESMGWDLVLT